MTDKLPIPSEADSQDEPLALPAFRHMGQFEEHDVVVIGSGPGASLAACLMAEAGREVLVLEEGDYWPLEAIEPFSSSEMRYKYRNGGITMALGRPTIQYVEGRCLGGGSEVNSGLHHRLPDETVWNWTARYGLEDFNPAELKSHSEAVERDLSVSLMPEGAIPEASLVLKNGAESLGWCCPEIPRYRRFGPNDSTGERQTMIKTYLPRAKAAGAGIVHGARAVRIKRPKNGGAYQLDIHINKPDYPKIRAEVLAKTVILGAGPVGSALLLRRSGLSAKSGKFLHLHPTVKLIAQFDRVINYPGLGVPVHQVKEFGSTMSFGCSISSPHYMSVSMASQPHGLEIVRDLWPHLIIYYATIVPEGYGSVTPIPGFKEPLVRFKLTKRDLAALSLAMKRLGRLLFAAGAKRLFPSVRGLDFFENPSDLDKIPSVLPAGKSELMTIHLTSTNPMAQTPELGVTDQWGALWGHKNLLISDASVLCSGPGVNPQGPLLTVARRNLTHYLGG
ncbi:MAG: GMC family oxidoreductase N-terminal domain-containing protein [Deltaproteobacteria bacterium]|jgi:choline dehydrogenase-like flavoprotein|nr:GMC family oxidoreductase N-terminal domain-containing protein [Deltaproteobacteria bacterium]